MKKDLLSFLIKILAYASVLFLVYSFIKNSVPSKFYFESTGYIFVFFFFVMFVFHTGILYSLTKSNRSFVSFYMMTTAAKFFLYMAVIVGYALLNPAKAVAFICNFLVLYILFNVFEVVVVYRQLQKKPAKIAKSDEIN